ncbi:MAG: Tat pathway signal protein [Saprospiraceae bacterium]|nr:Tat pathway signal protein [Saprospiraceae bacterium]
MSNYIRSILFLVVIFGCSHNRVKFDFKYSRSELKKRSFNFFWELADSVQLQIPDRYPTFPFSSIAATGFGLSAYLTGIENGYITRAQAAERVQQTLNTLWELPQGPDKSGVSGYKGFFYHFLTPDKARRYKNVELSSIDTGLLMAGVLSVMSYFDNINDPKEIEIRMLAEKLYRRVDWTWMMKANGKMSMGWHPEKGFIENDWHGYNEAMILLVMALGSPTHPIPDGSWSEWSKTYESDIYYGLRHIQFEPLFGHQYSHIWIDFKGIRDSFMMANDDDYFNNSVKASLSNRAYWIDNPNEYIGYGKQCWGLTACDGPVNASLKIDGKERQFFDYRARGASSFKVVDDGTISPTAAGGSFVFTPKESEACLSSLWNTYYKELIGPYGFKDAFNLTYKSPEYPNGWFDFEYLGIDQGPIVLMIQNHETSLIWKTMKKNPYIINGLKKAGFKGGWLDKIKIDEE